MDHLLGLIKKEIDASEFDRDFKDKETEINRIKTEIDKINDEITNN